jgi:hypothetical protein
MSTPEQCLEGCTEGRENSRPLVMESQLVPYVVVIIEHHDDTVGARQINSGIVFQLNLHWLVSQGHASMT